MKLWRLDNRRKLLPRRLNGRLTAARRLGKTPLRQAINVEMLIGPRALNAHRLYQPACESLFQESQGTHESRGRLSWSEIPIGRIAKW